MAKNVLNITTGCWLSPGMLALAFDSCSIGWSGDGSTVYSLNGREAAEARKALATKAERNDSTEIPGLRFSSPNPAVARAGRDLVRAANWFFDGSANRMIRTKERAA